VGIRRSRTNALGGSPPPGPEVINLAPAPDLRGTDLEPEFTSIAPELASLSPELEPWQAESIAAELSPDITFDAPE